MEVVPWFDAEGAWPRASSDDESDDETADDGRARPPRRRCAFHETPGAAARLTHAFLNLRELCAVLETSKASQRRAAALVRGTLWYPLVTRALAPYHFSDDGDDDESDDEVRLEPGDGIRVDLVNANDGRVCGALRDAAAATFLVDVAFGGRLDVALAALGKARRSHASRYSLESRYPRQLRPGVVAFGDAGRGDDSRSICWSPTDRPARATSPARAHLALFHYVLWGGDDAVFIAGRCPTGPRGGGGAAPPGPTDWAAARAPEWFSQQLREALGQNVDVVRGPSAARPGFVRYRGAAPQVYAYPHLRRASRGGASSDDASSPEIGDRWLRNPVKCVCGHSALTAFESALVLQDCDFDLCPTCATARLQYKLEERKQEERLADAKMNKKAELKKRHDKGKKHGSSAKPRSQKRK